MTFDQISFDDDADEPKTWKGLAISAIMDLRRYAADESPYRRLVSAEAYEEDAVRLASMRAGWNATQRELEISELHAEIQRLRWALAEIRKVTNNPEDNGVAVVMVYYAATMALREASTVSNINSHGDSPK